MKTVGLLIERSCFIKYNEILGSLIAIKQSL